MNVDVESSMFSASSFESGRRRNQY